MRLGPMRSERRHDEVDFGVQCGRAATQVSPRWPIVVQPPTGGLRVGIVKIGYSFRPFAF